MQSKIKVALAIVATLLFSTCNEDDFNPDLSGEISFNWTWNNAIDNPDYYVLISDAEGRSLGWKQLLNGQTTTMGYPPNEQTAYVSIISNHKISGGGSFMMLRTFVDIPSGNYSYGFLDPLPWVPSGLHDVNIEREFFDDWNVVPSSAKKIEEKWTDDIFTSVVGLEPTTNKLFTSVRKRHDREWRYLYAGIEDEETTTIDEESYSSLLPMNKVDINFAPYEIAGFGNGGVKGRVKGSDIFYSLSRGFWNSENTPSLWHIDIPEVFSEYRLYAMTEAGASGESHYVEIPFEELPTSIPSLNTTLNLAENNTRRIAAEINGDGDIVMFGASWRETGLDASYYIYAPKTSSFAVNVPQFPADLIAELPQLSNIYGKKFQILGIMDVNMSYDDFSIFRMTADLNLQTPYMVSKSFSITNKP